MATTIYANSNNIYGLRGNSTTYLTAHTTYSTTQSDIYGTAGQTISGSTYYVYRLFVAFTLGSSYISACDIFLPFYYEANNITMDIEVRGFTESTLSSNSASFTGYGSTIFASQEYTSTSTANFSQSLNASGLSYMNGKRNGTCVFSIVSDEDMAESAPTVSERENFYSAEYSGDKPYISVTYGTEPITWKPKIMWIMKSIIDDRLDFIRKPLQSDLFLRL